MSGRIRGLPDDWEQVGPHFARRRVVDVPGARFELHRLDAGFRNALHEHREAQLDVVISGEGTHRSVVARLRGGQATQQLTATAVGPGDCYYIPSHVPHEFAVGSTGPVLLLEVMLVPREAHGDAPFVAHATSSRSNRWMRADAQGARAQVIARTPEAEFAYYELPVGYHGPRHTHPHLQAGVCLGGEILHRMELSVRQGRRTLRQSTDLTIRNGDCYFIPAGVPHESWVVGMEPCRFVDVLLNAPRRSRGQPASARAPRRGAVPP